MNALEQIVVTGCPTCGAPAQAIAEGEGVRYRHVDTATLKAAQGGVTEAMVRRVADALSIAGWDIGGDREDFEADIRDALEAALSAEPAAQGDGDFKNFHRLLCERFGYVHDPVNWKRDQLSLIEHIARAAQPAERVPDGWKLAMRVLQSDLYAKLPAEDRAVCDALIAENPYINLPATPAEEGDGKEVSRG